MNQPVTFHRQVRSAGYGPSSDAPRVLGRPKRVAARQAVVPAPDFGPPKAGAHRPASATRAGVAACYAAGAAEPPLQHCIESVLAAYPSCAVTNLCFTPQATHLVVAGSDRSVSSYRLPLSRQRGGVPARPVCLAGHQAEVLSMCPSYADSHSSGGGGGPLLLTAGADKTARLWALGGPRAGEDLICFDRLRTSSKPAHREDNPVLEQVNDAQFLCLDGAIALALGHRLGIYRYQLHVQDTSDDIRRLQQLGSFKCCGVLSLPRGQGAAGSIVALAANNAILSGTLVVASSSKQIHVWDVAAEKVLASAQEASSHSRSITCLRLAQPHSDFQSPESMDIFYTASLDNTVKLWDLRSMQAIRCFEGGHTHTAHRLSCRLSPCLRYMCAPSEDGSVCVYDVRTGRVLGSQHRHRDTVAAVDVHPRSGCMATGGFDGNVHFFKPPASAPLKRCGRPPGNQLERPPMRSSESRVREVQMGGLL